MPQRRQTPAERSHDRADNGADAKELRALNTARRNREGQRSHGNIEGRISNIKTYKQNSRVNDVEDQRGIGTADKEQDHHKRHKPRGPFDIGTHLAVLRAGAIHQNPHDGIVDRIKDPAKKRMLDAIERACSPGIFRKSTFVKK